MEKFRNIIVIGASAGGLSATSRLLAQIPGTIDAAVFIVLHLSIESNANTIAEILQKKASLVCNVPKDVTMIQRGYTYIAPANHHILVKNNVVTVNNGPHENKYRPSIDVLFRTAAVHYGPRVIGIILSGMLEDGTSGMSAIKRCGGICIVQDPADAEYGDMPQSVINQITVDYKMNLNEMGYLLSDIMSKPLPPEVPVPRELKIEAEITEKMMTSIDDLREIADKSDFTCPSCGGGLWAIKNDPAHRYRCHTGHVFTEKTLSDIQDSNLEESIYVCVRMLEERRNMLGLMATHAEQYGNTFFATDNKNRAEELEKHIDRLKFILNKLVENRAEKRMEA